MFFLYFIVWVIFNGKLTWEIAIFGIAVSTLVYAFTCKYLGYSVQMDIRLMKKAGKILNLFGTLIVEIFKANEQVICWVYGLKKNMEPAIVQFNVPLKTTAARVALADCITLTPGTITGSLEENVYVVHCLDRSMAEGIDQSIFVELLKDLEKMEEKQDDV